MSVKKIARRKAKRAAAASKPAAIDADESAVERTIRRRETRIKGQITHEFNEASDELGALADEFKRLYDEQERHMQVLLKWGRIDEAQYKTFLNQTIVQSERFRRMQSAAASYVNNAGKAAADFLNDRLAWFFTQDCNYTMYTIDGVTSELVSFELIDEQAVRRLALRRPKLLPEIHHNSARTTQWVEQRLRHEVTAGIIRGESVDDIAKRFEHVTHMPKAACMTNARTAINGARNGGKQEALERAEAAGINVQKEWRATLDMRTRDSHQYLDGERIGVNEYFSNGLLHPGDANGAPEELYNCRCTMRTIVDGKAPEKRLDATTGNVIGYVTYDEWLAQKLEEAGADG